MTTRVEQPSEAERFEAETEAGPGADDATLTSNVDSEKGNDKPVSPSGSLHAGAVPEQEKVVEDKRRSKGKTVLLMGALCVRTVMSTPARVERRSTDIDLVRWLCSSLRLTR